MNRRHALNNAARQLAEAGTPDALLDAEFLLANVLGLSRLIMLLDCEARLSDEARLAFEALVKLRASGEPLQYVLSEACFMGHTFYVDHRVLIPRADTEPLCEAAIERLSEGSRALDIGTGSGAIAISMALAEKRAHVTAVDISGDVLCVARHNAERLGARVTFAQSDLFEALSGQVFDIVVSNPPYIPSGALSALQREVQKEPVLALDGGRDGLLFYGRILEGLPGHLTPGGTLLLEVGDGQADDVARLAARHFRSVSIRKDLQGLTRVVIGETYAG